MKQNQGSKLETVPSLRPLIFFVENGHTKCQGMGKNDTFYEVGVASPTPPPSQESETPQI